MTTSIYVPHFAEGKNYTVKYAEILRPCNVLVTAYTQCADNVMREHKYSLRCTTSIAAFNDYTPAVDLSDWTFKSLNADDHIVKIFLQYENDKIYLCADASVVKLIELKTIVPADIVSVNILRLEPLSYIRVEEDEYCLNPHFNSFCFHIALEPGEQSTFIAQSVGGKSVRTSIETILQGNPTLNNGLTEITNTGGYDRITITATDERQEFYLMISDIRNLKYFEMPGHVCGLFDISRLLHCAQLTYLHLKEGATGSSASLQSLRHFDTLIVDNAGIDIDLAHFANTRLKWLDIRVGANTENLSFSIDALASYDNKDCLESIFFRGEYAHQLQGIAGSLGSLSGFRYLRELVIPYTGITGDISSLKPSIEILKVSYSKIEGNLSALKDFTNLKELLFANTAISGKIDDLSATKVERVITANCSLNGDLSTLPGSCVTFSNENANPSLFLRWIASARAGKIDATSNLAQVLSIESPCFILGDDINNMLIDQMNCNIRTEIGEILIRTNDNHIQLNRSMLNSALQSLRSKGILDLQIDDEVFIENGVIKI